MKLRCLRAVHQTPPFDNPNYYGSVENEAKQERSIDLISDVITSGHKEYRSPMAEDIGQNSNINRNFQILLYSIVTVALLATLAILLGRIAYIWDESHRNRK